MMFLLKGIDVEDVQHRLTAHACVLLGRLDDTLMRSRRHHASYPILKVATAWSNGLISQSCNATTVISRGGMMILTQSLFSVRIAKANCVESQQKNHLDIVKA
ncbi:hypothetical protein K0I73_09450 [Shewanella mesophila]|uniref:hypothetical protein n=1 Tax=Shewanella mesophila TaxID=2864208 RepID=UPI001C659992|nr:hypothetical protein [Shewanella mesophila]QYJ87873.1 hypothetical protein K0I73_09450 [Shewanella mesophila]